MHVTPDTAADSRPSTNRLSKKDYPGEVQEAWMQETRGQEFQNSKPDEEQARKSGTAP